MKTNILDRLCAALGLAVVLAGCVGERPQLGYSGDQVVTLMRVFQGDTSESNRLEVFEISTHSLVYSDSGLLLVSPECAPHEVMQELTWIDPDGCLKGLIASNSVPMPGIPGSCRRQTFHNIPVGVEGTNHGEVSVGPSGTAYVSSHRIGDRFLQISSMADGYSPSYSFAPLEFSDGNAMVHGLWHNPFHLSMPAAPISTQLPVSQWTLVSDRRVIQLYERNVRQEDGLDRIEHCLRLFYSRNLRWPMNEEEFRDTCFAGVAGVIEGEVSFESMGASCKIAVDGSTMILQ